MATIDTPFRDTCYNPWICHSRVTTKIVLFGEGKEIASHGSGWLKTSAGGSNNELMTVFSDLPVYRKRKIDLNFPHSFMVGEVMYVNVNDLPDFQDLGEEVANEFKHETNYGHFVTFTSGDKRDPTPRTMRVMMGTYTRCVPTPRGEHINTLNDFIEEVSGHRGRYGAEKLYDKRDELIALLQSF